MLPEHFPEGRQRIKNSCHPNDYGTFGIEKIKGDLFKLTKWHEVRPVRPISLPLAHFGIINNQQGEYEWRASTASDFRMDAQLERELNRATEGITEMVEAARYRIKRKRFSLITSTNSRVRAMNGETA